MHAQTPVVIATPDFVSLEARLHGLARAIAADEPAAEPALRALLDDIGRSADPRAVGLYVFAGALARRLSGATQEQANLYLSRFEVPQIHLFNLLGRAVPFVGLATTIANDAIVRAIGDARDATVIDVGIGTGRQMGHLIETLAAGDCPPASLTVIGIEPAEWALDDARRQVEQAGRLHGIEVRFVAFAGTAEALGSAEWRRMQASCRGPVVVNASFALHHIADDQGRDQRNRVLARLHRLQPTLLVLSEPDVDHLEPGFYERFRNCYAHFGAVFRTLDRLALEQADRDALKVGFFGREIADILSTPEAERSERHECAAAWLKRLSATGFDVRVEGGLPPVPANACQAVRLARRAYHVSIDAIDEPVVSVFTAVPVRAGTTRARSGMSRSTRATGASATTTAVVSG